MMLLYLAIPHYFNLSKVFFININLSTAQLTNAKDTLLVIKVQCAESSVSLLDENRECSCPKAS